MDDPTSKASIPGGVVFRSQGYHFVTALARASIEIAACSQFGLPARLGFLSPGPVRGLAFQRLPTLNETHPKRPVAGIACSSGKATAFIGSPPKFIYNHVAPLCRPAHSSLHRSGIHKLYQNMCT
jgi:hypothetical protein